MTDYSELVKKLRDLHRDPRPASAVWLFDNQIALYDAADAIEALQADQKKTVTQIFGEEQMAWEGRCKDLMYQIADLQAQLPKRGEIVRCKECRWGHLCVTGQHLGLDGFCSKGEREVQDDKA